MKRCLPARLAAGLSLLPGVLAAQSSLSSDLWRVAAATVSAPAPLIGGAAALLWTPVVSLAPDATAEIGLVSFQAPEEIGVTGGAVSASLRVGSTVLTAAWGRLGIDGIVRTETSPEAVAGRIDVDAQVFAMGVTRRLAPWLDAGLALRAASDRLGSATSTRAAFDAGAVAAPSRRVTLGAALRAVDPLDGGGSDPSYVMAAEVRSGDFGAAGGAGALRLRYGTTLQRGESAAHLLSAGMTLGAVFAMDVGAVREARAGHELWRSRIGLSLTTRHYQLQFGRDGGVNGFGATYALGLAARFR